MNKYNPPYMEYINDLCQGVVCQSANGSAGILDNENWEQESLISKD